MEKQQLKSENRDLGKRISFKNFKFFIVVFSFSVLVFSLWLKLTNAQSTGNASNTDNTSSANASDQQQIQDKQQQIEDLRKKAESYRQMIEMKQNKAETLENQIKLMESQISSLEGDVAVLQRDIDTTSGEIGALSAEIEEKEKSIAIKKKILSGVIQTYYEKNQDSTVEILMRGTSLSEYLGQSDYISQAGTKVDELLTTVVSAKKDLEQDRVSLEKKNEDQKERRGKVMEKKRSLDNEQYSREQLLVQTQGEEEKYQGLLVRVEQQKQELLGDIDELSQEKSSDLAAVEATIEKPKSGLSSTSWYFSQRDPRWGNQHIGFSNTLMKSYGCAVTAVSMVFRYHGSDIDPGTMAQQSIFYHDLIVWPAQWKGIKLVSSHTHGNLDWDIIDQELKNKNPVIVFIKAVKRGAGHYVVIHSKDKNGEYVAHDPYWGENMFLKSTRRLVGALYNSPTEVDQMIIYH